MAIFVGLNCLRETNFCRFFKDNSGYLTLMKEKLELTV